MKYPGFENLPNKTTKSEIFDSIILFIPLPSIVRLIGMKKYDIINTANCKLQKYLFFLLKNLETKKTLHTFERPFSHFK